MLIVEGTDMVGKTTLCMKLLERLQKRGPWIYSHFSKLPEWWDYYWNYLQHMARHQVMDRFHMSEVAYRHAREEPQRLLPETYRLLDGHLRLRGALTVVVLATDDWLRDRVEAMPRPEMHTPDQIVRANHAFDSLIHNNMGEYRVDYDMQYVVGLHGQDYPSENEELMTRVLHAYLERQARVYTTQRVLEEDRGQPMR